MRTFTLFAILIFLVGCGTFHPEPYELYADHPEFNPDTAATVSVSALAENEYTVLRRIDVLIRRDDESAWRQLNSNESWWISLPPGEYTFVTDKPGTFAGLEKVTMRKEDGVLVVDDIDIAPMIEIQMTIEAGKKYRFVRTDEAGNRGWDLREMEYIGDLWNTKSVRRKRQEAREQ